VALRTSAGMAVDAEGFDLATDRTWLESHGAVQAKGPMGDVTAGALRLDKAATGPGYVLVFNKGVRLLYQPKH
jgi:lipopolysaccharide export system protein LptC